MTSSPAATARPAGLRVHPSVAAEMVGNELLVVQAEQGTALTLNQTARQMWELIVLGCTAEEVADRLHARFDVPKKQLEIDAAELIRQLEECKVLRRETPGHDLAR